MDFAHKKLDTSCIHEFTDHLKIPGNDTNTVPKEDRSLKVTIYKKPTLMNQYFNFVSNDPLEQNISMVKTLHHKATVVITEGTDIIQEEGHVMTAPHRKGDTAEHQCEKKAREAQVALLYIKGLSKELRCIFRAHGCDSFFKHSNPLRQFLIRQLQNHTIGGITTPIPKRKSSIQVLLRYDRDP